MSFVCNLFLILGKNILVTAACLPFVVFLFVRSWRWLILESLEFWVLCRQRLPIHCTVLLVLISLPVRYLQEPSSIWSLFSSYCVKVLILAEFNIITKTHCCQNFTYRHIPVSYTHLDVYKRQINNIMNVNKNEMCNVKIRLIFDNGG